MTTCLSDRSLWSLSEGHGAAGEREHVARCVRCACQMDRLVADVRVIARVLRDEPPPARHAMRARLSFARLAVAAAVLVLAVGISFLTQRQPSFTLAAGDDGIAVLGEMSADVFDDGEVVGAATPADEVATALALAAPCEWQPAGCRDIGQPLF